MIKKILLFFTIWRSALFFIAFLAYIFINVFGGRFPYYDEVLKVTNLPEWVWGFGNFDGVHYLRIAQNGYNAQFSQAFFPLYPLLINLFNLFPKNPEISNSSYVDPSFFFTAIILSNIFFILSLIFFYKLLKFDFNKKIAFRSLILLLSFPTSFYFVSIYTESLFLFLAVITFYFIKKGNFLAAGISAALASATRILGILLIPVLLIEIYLKFKKNRTKSFSQQITKSLVGVLIAPFGTLLYMLYLRITFDNPLYFFTSQPMFGAERTSEALIFLPQVIYRYLNIFSSIPVTSQAFFNAFLEFSFAGISLVSLVFFFKKMKISYFIFTLGCLIVPTLSGTFSSMPRYSLMGFLLLPYICQAIGKYYLLLAGFFMVVGTILLSLFIRGYWIA